MRNRHKFTFIFCCILLDLLAMFIGPLIYLNSAKENHINWNEFLSNNMFMISIISWLLPTLYFRLYQLDSIFSLEVFYRNTWHSCIIQCFLWYSYLFLFQDDSQYSIVSSANLFQLTFLISYMVASRALFTVILTKMKRWVKKPMNVAIWGFNRTSIELASQLETNSYFVNFLGILNNKADLQYRDKEEFSLALVNGIHNASLDKIDEMYVVAKPDYIKDLNSYFELADKYCMRLKFVPDFSMLSRGQFSTTNFNNFHVIRPRFEPLQNAYNRLIKRIFDIVFSLAVIILILSWLYPLMGIIIKKQSKGPVLFKQLRTGKKNKTFWCYKFRSMKNNAVSDIQQARKNDDRVTPIGKFMRRTSIDEMPQFFNVLLGDMSVVGPRPHMIKHTEDYNEQVNNFMVRHFVKPGITGLAQVSGFRGEITDVSDIKRRVDADIHYLQNWSLAKDIKICFLTVFNSLKGDDKAF
ncbi:exopolysaccharide biosynthesis polyprenyl glycosylphosphotransferase [Flavobacterium aquiphilum]|uniref:exopolysaccharide biosynthesis polyprenyl glycosylphosphotransferase n=1 Tax=Flavobacterium aquiphilum TaxID=3003261 RepID=UPI00247FAE79|nr:exopolysaccharide biosynthesis polyprenyl glycosylphosphotransferase [Flavobacterium aquiphilum]